MNFPAVQDQSQHPGLVQANGRCQSSSPFWFDAHRLPRMTRWPKVSVSFLASSILLAMPALSGVVTALAGVAVVGSTLAGCDNGSFVPPNNTDPTASIAAPLDKQTFKPGVALILKGFVSDRESDPDALSIQWSISGTEAGGGAQYSRTLAGTPSADGTVQNSLDEGLPEGTFTITLLVADSSDGTASASIGILITNKACELEVDAPISGWTADPSTNVYFRGTISDPDPDDLPASLRVSLQDPTEPTLYYLPITVAQDTTWATTAQFQVPGEHSVTVVGKDQAGKECRSAPIVVRINQCTTLDSDGDKFTGCQGDCNDTNATVYPGASEICNDGLDNNCDKLIDQGYDGDSDGYDKCDPVTPDCDDTNPNIHPNAPEGCNGLDNDCVGGPASSEADADDDGYRFCAGDCNDADPTIFPGAPEICNAQDDNCDGSLGGDERDQDVDGVLACEQDDLAADCDDTNPEVNPLQQEVCGNAIDENCDGDTTAVDADKDGYDTCTDCNDFDAAINPGKAEGPSDPSVPGGLKCDGIDNDCDGRIDDGTTCVDDDGDGKTDAQGDCDDYNFYTYPGAPERPDLQDNNCDGKIETSPLTLDSAHVRLKGDLVGAGIGSALSSGHDINGAEAYEEGAIDDLLIGAPAYDVVFTPSQNRGAAFVLMGRSSGWDALDGQPISDDATLLYEEEPSARAGFALGMTGDLDGDGIGDFAVGAPYHSVTGSEAVGRTYILFGKSSGWAQTTLTSASLSSVEGLAAAPDSNNLLMGYAVAGGLDINGDGLDDSLYGVPWLTQPGATGWVTLVSGRYTGWSAKLKPTELTRLQGPAGHAAGRRMAVGGFNNGDALADFLVGTEYDTTTGSGSVLWCYGDASYIPNVQFSLDASRCREYYGTVPYDYIGDDLSGETDLDNDGYDDFLIGRRNATSSNVMAWAVFGGLEMPASGTMDSLAALRFTASADGKDECPCTVMGIPDMNGDRIGDLAIATSRTDLTDGSGNVIKDVGRLYVFYGRANRTAWTAALPGDISLDKADLKIVGERADDQAGSDMATGDVNCDGRSDLIVSAVGWDDNKGQSNELDKVGRIYVLFGSVKTRNPNPDVVRASLGGILCQ